MPLYIPFIENDESFQRQAIRLGGTIGLLAAESGKLDLLALLQSERLPLRQFLRDRLIAVRENAEMSHALQFGTQMNSYSRGDLKTAASDEKRYTSFNVEIFDGEKPTSDWRLSVSMPPDVNSPQFRRELDAVVDDVLGAGGRRSRLKSSARRRAGLDNGTSIRTEPDAHVQLRPPHNALAQFQFADGGRVLAFSLGTKDQETAEKRLDEMRKFIRRSLSERGTFTLGDLKSFGAGIVHPPLDGSHRGRINRTRRGPVVIYERASTPGSAAESEALRCYLQLSWTDDSGFSLRMNLVDANGRGTQKMYTIDCNVAPGHRMTLKDAERMRDSLGDFLDQRLSAFFHAGGKFRDMEDIAWSRREPDG